jgi:hypothetical protein
MNLTAQESVTCLFVNSFFDIYAVITGPSVVLYVCLKLDHLYTSVPHCTHFVKNRQRHKSGVVHQVF